MFTPAAFQTATLHSHPFGEAVARILAAALNAVEPGAAVKNFLRGYALPTSKRIFALGLGKAALPMTQALTDLLPLTSALVITKHAAISPAAGLTVMEGGHPIPNESSLAAGQAALDFVSGLEPDDLLICLISGGGSALMTAPLVPLADMQALTSALLACGTRIDEINTLRRALDRVKGSGLARSANGAAILSLILSDVVGNPLEAIASGPTVPNPTTNADALNILAHYRLTDQIPASILAALQNPPVSPLRHPSSPSVFERVQNHIIGSNLIAAQAAAAQAEQEGFQTSILCTDLQGEARTVAAELTDTLRQVAQSDESTARPFCLIAGGETTVTLRGNGTGGRNQELALAAVSPLAGMKDVMLVALATDGEDGPTDAAGAVVTGETLAHGQRLGITPQPFLENNDAYHYFERLGDLLKPGPTGTNVNDLTFLFRF
jgi:glycerate 2-kinase